MKGIIRISNISDVITNSSSEVFVVKTNRPNTDLKELITKHHQEHYWYGVHDLDDVPSGLKHILTDELIELIREESNSGSGMGGECSVYDWRDGFERYKKYNHLTKLTVEEWAEKLNKPLEELQSIVVVDIDWECRATINMLERDFNIINENDDAYDDFYYTQFVYGYQY